MIPFEKIQEKAFELGWNDVGVTDAEIPEEDVFSYKNWLEEGLQADLAYMENQVRCSPQGILEGARSAIIFITYYKQEKLPFKDDAGLVASYARGRDYHHVHRKRLKKFIQWLEEYSGVSGCAKGFSDSTPVMEKALAVRAGLGWFGKNTLLIHPKFGTFTLLSGLFTTLEVEGKKLNARLPRCGTCTKCLDACPTSALISPYKLNAAKCLSYHLIESKKPLPDEIRDKNPGYAFGCDICQDACPHNKLKKETLTPEFHPDKGMGAYLDKPTLELLPPDALFGTPLQRRGLAGLKHTLN